MISSKVLDKPPNSISVCIAAVYLGCGCLRFDSKLGSGAFGIIYLGQWLSRHTTVAIKLLHSKSFTQSVYDQFLAELAIMNKISSPHVLRLWGACLEPENIALVLVHLNF